MEVVFTEIPDETYSWNSRITFAVVSGGSLPSKLSLSTSMDYDNPKKLNIEIMNAEFTVGATYKIMISVDKDGETYKLEKEFVVK